jgi:hypothetical protein
VAISDDQFHCVQGAANFDGDCTDFYSEAFRDEGLRIRLVNAFVGPDGCGLSTFVILIGSPWDDAALQGGCIEGQRDPILQVEATLATPSNKL